MGKRRWLLGFLAIWGSALVLAAPAVGWGGVDRSFGQGGWVRLDPSLLGYEAQLVQEMGVGPGGGIFLLDVAARCRFYGCPWDFYVTRRKPNGSPDGSYAGGTGAQLVFAGSPTHFGELTVDRKGRAIVVRVEPAGVSLARLLPSGSFDYAFGDGGRVVIPCDCDGGAPLIRVDRGGRIYLVLSDVEYSPAYPEDLSYQRRVLVARLLPDGQLDAGFGQGGWSEARLSDAGGPDEIVVGRNGSLFLAGSYRCCGPFGGIFVLRIGPRGGVDQAFGAKAGAALEGLPFDPSQSTSPVSMLARAKGVVDLFGNSGKAGFVVRLRRDGSLAPRFGRGGIRFLPWRIGAIGRFRDGRVIVIGGQGSYPESGALVFAMEADGGLDRAYGHGAPIVLQNWDPFGGILAMQRGERPLFLDLGLPECRQYCPPRPKLLRLRSPWDRG